jgi:hypothetical protein
LEATALGRGGEARILAFPYFRKVADPVLEFGLPRLSAKFSRVAAAQYDHFSQPNRHIFSLSAG